MFDETLLSTLAKEGIGYVLAALIAWLYIQKEKKYDAEVKQHLQDIKDAGDKGQKSAEIMTSNHVEALEKANAIAQAGNQIAQSSYQILQNLQQSSNIRKQ